MKLGLFVNEIQSERENYTTTRLAQIATNRGSIVYYISAADFSYDQKDFVKANTTRVPKNKYKNLKSYLSDLKSPQAICEKVNVADLDVLLLRNDPAQEPHYRAWAQTVGVMFGQFALRLGVIVLNDPTVLGTAMNKMYFQLFPEEIRPVSLITLDRSDIKAFAKEFKTVVLKPLQGSGGKGVFLVRPEDASNINQIIDSISRDGYVLAQEYLKEAESGDTRLFMMNGQPLKYKGKFAAFRRIRKEGDMRSNVHAGGTLKEAEIGEQELKIAEIVRPKLVSDGMFLVGLDIVGNKLMEVNVFSPGGLGSAQSFEKVNFANAVIDALERKVAYVNFYKRQFNNIQMASL